jgi:hypothetical protein
MIDREIAEDLEALAIKDSSPASLCAPGPDVLDDPYPCWNATTSRVVSGPLGPRANFPGQRYDNWAKAKLDVGVRYSLIKFWVLGSRWFARVKR